MTNENDANPGANPEPLADLKRDTVIEPATDDVDEGPDFEIIDAGTIGDPSAKPAAAEPLAPPAPLEAAGTLWILEAQLGEALKIMQDLAAWVRHPGSDIHTCLPVADAVGQLARASATLAKVAVRLQNGDPESRHRVIVEYAEPGGGGVRQSRKRINHGRA